MISKITSYYQRALTRLPAQFKNKPRIATLLFAFASEFQAIEEAAWDLLVSRILSNSPTGDLEDKLGAIVGQPRNGASDADYIVYIAARIKTNRSDSKRRTLIAIARLLIPYATQILFREYVKAIEIEVYSVAGDPFVIWNDFFLRAKNTTTSLQFIWSDQPYEDLLILDSVYGGVNTVDTQWLSSVYGGGGTGVLASIFGSA